MARKGENIYKRKDGRWEGRYIKGRIDNKAVYGYVYAKTYKEVREKLTEKKSQLIFEKERNGKNEYFTNIAKEWYSSLDGSVKMSSKMKYCNCITNYINPYLGNSYIRDIDYFVVLEWCKRLLDSGGISGNGLSGKTVSDSLTILKTIMRYASRMKYDVDYTVFDVSVRQKSKRLRIFSETEKKKLYEYLNENLDIPNLGILICMYTGMRIGELCALTWENVSLEDETIYINKTLMRLQTPNGPNKTEIIISEPKSQDSIRHIPIAPPLLPYLQRFQKDSGYLLPGNCKKHIEPRSLQYHFSSILKKCDIKGATFHTLRHSFATHCIELGFDIKTLSEILGHANVNITLNRYVHPSMKSKKKNMDLLKNDYTEKSN